MWVKPTRFSNYVASLIDSGDRRCTAGASIPSSALKNYAISCRNSGLLGNWTARHIVENVKDEKPTDCARAAFGHALSTLGRMWVGTQGTNQYLWCLKRAYESMNDSEAW